MTRFFEILLFTVVLMAAVWCHSQDRAASLSVSNYKSKEYECPQT